MLSGSQRRGWLASTRRWSRRWSPSRRPRWQCSASERRATRPFSVAIAVGLTVLVADRRGALTHDPKRGSSLVRRFRVPNRVAWSALERRDAGILAGFGGLAAYMVFLEVQFGQSLLFVKVQEYWGQSSGFDTLAKRQYWWELTHHVHSSLVITTSLQGCLLLVGLSASHIWGSAP